MAGELLAPAVDQGLLGGRHPAGAHREADQPTADQAAVGVRTRARRADVVPARRAAARDGVTRIQDVHVGAGREVRVERHPEQTAVPVVVDLGREVGEDRRGRVRDAVEDLDDPGLLRDEHAAVIGEPQRGRQGHPRPYVRVAEAVEGRRCRGELGTLRRRARRAGRAGVVGQEPVGRCRVRGRDRQDRGDGQEPGEQDDGGDDRRRVMP